MKKIIFLLLIIIYLAGFNTKSYGYYYKVDALDLSSTGPTKQYICGSVRYLRQDFTVTNAGSESLADVGLVWTYLSSGDWTFEYNSDSHNWEKDIIVGGASYGVHAVEIFSFSPFNPNSTQTYLSLTRDNTDLLINNAQGSSPLSLTESDEIPVFWLGDLLPGQSTTVTWYAGQSSYISPTTNSGWSFNITPDFVAQAEDPFAVPLPGSVWFMCSGLFFLLSKTKKSFHWL